MLHYRRLGSEEMPGYLPDILGLVREEAERADTLINSGESGFYEKFFSPAGAIWGAFVEERLVGFTMLGFSTLLPAVWDPCIDAVGADRLLCGACRSILVGGSYRRHGVGAALNRLRISHARERGLTHLFVTVHPGNAGSLELFARHGFTVIGQIDTYEDGHPRIVLCLAVDSVPV